MVFFSIKGKWVMCLNTHKSARVQGFDHEQVPDRATCSIFGEGTFEMSIRQVLYLGTVRKPCILKFEIVSLKT